MRRGLGLGACIIGFFGTAASGVAQFAPDRPSAAPPPVIPSGLQPTGSAASPTAAPFLNPLAGTPSRDRTPVPSSIKPKAAAHAWEVKAENGAWMICVKAYQGPDSLALAEKLTKYIREKKGVAAFLFERNAEEKRREAELIDSIRQAEREKVRPLLERIEQEKKEAKAQGREFYDEPMKYRIPKPYHETPEQWAVLIGGFKDPDAAKEGLKLVKKFDTKDLDAGLMDRTEIGGTGSDNQYKEAANFINPFASSFVVPNPKVSQANLAEKGKLEEFVVKFNADVPHSLIKVPKPWTLIVRSYSTPARITGKDGDGNVFDQIKKFGQKSMLDVTAEEAERFAEALRHPNMKPHPLEAYVLHHRTGSIVTVGQFDAADAPDLLAMQQTLLGMTFLKQGPDQKPLMGKDGKPEVERMFDSVSPFPVPRK